MIVGDFSTSATAEGKVRLYYQAQEPVPEGWLIDKNGASTLNPGDLYAGGAILPSGGHKGFALGLLVEILGGVLAGEGCACRGDDPGNGVVLIAIETSRISPLDEFGAQVDLVVEALEAVPAAPGSEGVILPGQPEERARAVRASTGIPFADGTWDSIVRSARSVGVEPDTSALLV
jgi:uncharacterized oxidoreductase